MHKLLFIDDDAELLDIISSEFQGKNYLVYSDDTAVNIVKHVTEIEPDCIILDVMMPEMDGFAAFAKVREISDVPIIFLTGRVSEDDRVNGLVMGADDYIVKPFSFRELEARIAMVIRRRAAAVSENSTTLVFPPLEINTASRQVMAGDIEISLTQREYELLLMMAKSEGGTITYEQIGMALWGAYREEDRASVMVNVSRLRKKMDVDPLCSRLIETVWSKGYRFVSGRETR